MTALRGAWLLWVLLGVPLAARGEPLEIEARSAPAPGGRTETRLHLAVNGEAATGPALVILMVFRGERAVASARWTARPAPSACRAPFQETRVFSLEPGAYRARVRVELPGGDGLEREAAFRVPDDAGEDLVLGELTLGCCVEEESPPDTLVPHGAGAFGEGTTPCVGFRVADGRPDLPDSAYQVRVRLRHDAEEVAHELRLPRGGRFAEGFWRSDALGAGSYTLTVEARVGKLRKERTARFSVAGTRVARDPWVMRALIEYVATPEELQEAEQAPDDSLAAVWTRFWERRDPDPGTPVNEALVLFETRVETASRRYGVMEPGWQSDQGRIYIRLGEPDRVETIAADAYRAAGEIWYYYGRHATYVFQDVDGFGRLRLVGGR